MDSTINEEINELQIELKIELQHQADKLNKNIEELKQNLLMLSNAMPKRTNDKFVQEFQTYVHKMRGRTDLHLMTTDDFIELDSYITSAGTFIKKNENILIRT